MRILNLACGARGNRGVTAASPIKRIARKVPRAVSARRDGLRSPAGLVACLTLLGLVWPLSSRLETGALAAPSNPLPWDTMSDTWSATDALGRVLPNATQAGSPRRDRWVGVFYFLWHGPHINGGPYNVSEILQREPGAMLNPASLLWGPLGAMHHWGESQFGYYLADDAYVLRRHAQMLADAGVDFIIFDVTNQATYKSYYMALLKVFAEVRAAGGRTPRIAFLTPFWDSRRVVGQLYADLYQPGLYSDLWFRWEGKPLILADPWLIGETEGTEAHNVAMLLQAGHTLGQSFAVTRPFEAVSAQCPTFTTTNSGMTLTLYRDGPQGEQLASQTFDNLTDNAWVSLRSSPPLTPGTYYLEMSSPRGTPAWWSQAAKTWSGGRAFADRSATNGSRALRVEISDQDRLQLRSFFTFRKPQPDYFLGPTGPDMWSWLEVFPQHVFRNSKGEKEQMSVGVAQNAVDGRLGSLSEARARGRNWHNRANDPRPGAVNEGLNFSEQFEHALKEDPRVIFITGWNEWIASRFDQFAGVREPVMFVDQFNQERSRDIEPMKGGHGDNYYYQMVSYIRRYKGVRAPPPSSGPATIALDADFGDWAAVLPEYRDDIGDAARRDHPGWKQATRYVNDTGRNDFVAAKVARDAVWLYFYVRTKDPITPETGTNWMWLLLSVKGFTGTNWQGYNFVVNRTAAGVLEESTGGWNWRRAGTVRYRVNGCEMALAVRRKDLGLGDATKPLHLEFKWADNVQQPGCIEEFAVNGDAAPNGRFNYVYSAPGL